MKVFVTGATGFVGRMIVARLLGEGHRVVAWTRNKERARGILGADVELASAESTSLFDALEDCDAVVNLQGENLFAKRWTASQKKKLEDSRIGFTNQLVQAVTALGSKGPKVLVSASAVGYYGARIDEVADESTPAGTDFLAKLCAGWEAAALQAKSAGARVVTLRIGVVLGRDGGALQKMLPPFRMGVGGKLGSGRQYMAWIHIDDLVSLIHEALIDERYAGPVNAVAPTPVTNSELTRSLAKALSRPAIFGVPSMALRLALGEASSVLLGGQRAHPKRAQSLGFEFAHPRIDDAFDDILFDPSVSIRRIHDPDADYVLNQETLVDASIDEVFAFFSKAENLGAMTPPDLSFSIKGAAPSRVSSGTELEYDIRMGPIPMTWTTLIESFRAGISFIDVQKKGPYARWWHEHTFEPRGGKTLMKDTVRYRLPLGPFGRIAHRLFVSGKLKRIFGYRHAYTKLRFGRRDEARDAARAA